MQYTAHYESPPGRMTLAGDGTALTGLWFDGQKYYAAPVQDAEEAEDLPVFADTKRWLDLYFGGKDPGFTPALSAAGSDFRREVWKILLTIPYGQTMTYGEIAAAIAAERGIARMSAQAVGGAVGHNPISLIVPCHRVIGTDGSLTGYAGGLGRKSWLLEHEGVDMTALFLPKHSTAP